MTTLFFVLLAAFIAFSIWERRTRESLCNKGYHDDVNDGGFVRCRYCFRSVREQFQSDYPDHDKEIS